MTYPLRNKSQALQVLNRNRIKMVDSAANQKLNNPDKKLVGQGPEQRHRDGSQVWVEVRLSIKE